MGRNEMTYVETAVADKGFARRLQKLSRRHSKLSKGYLLSVNHDGLVVARPKRTGLRFPVRGLILTAFAVVGFKAFALAYLGEASYGERIAALRQGTTSERMAAFVMQADPVTRTVAGVIAPYLR
jgi:hypothetical protein